MATTRGTTLEQTARLFALLDMTQSDGLENSFGAKYQYALWRPITAIRDPRSDLINPDTQSDPSWTTLHPTTPAFPTYPSNAGAEGGTSATILASFFGTDHIPFQVHWDAYGFPGVTRSYTGFWAAADEEGRSRVYGGIHFTFDVTAGQELGRRVADYVLGNVLQPRAHPSSLTGAADGLAALTQPASSTLTLSTPGLSPGPGSVTTGQPSQAPPASPGAAAQAVPSQPLDSYFATLDANPLPDGLGDDLSWVRTV